MASKFAKFVSFLLVGGLLVGGHFYFSNKENDNDDVTNSLTPTTSSYVTNPTVTTPPVTTNNVTPSSTSTNIPSISLPEVEEEEDVGNTGKPVMKKLINNNVLFALDIIYSDLSHNFHTFYAVTEYIERFDAEVFGIAYTDYSDVYVDANNHYFYGTGFASLELDEPISDAEAMDMIEIYSEEKGQSEDYTYFYNQKPFDYQTHFVKDNKYVTIDIIDGNIVIEENEYYYGMDVEYSRGNIYNYDTEEYVYIVEEKDHLPVTGASLNGEFTPDKINEAIDEIIESQTLNMTYEEAVSQVNYAHEAFNSYLLTYQEETFFGVSTDILFEVSLTLDPMQHIRLVSDSEGNIFFDVIEIKELPTLAEKIIVSVIAAHVAIASIIISRLFPANFLVNGIIGAVMGAVMEVFAHVIFANESLSTFNWAHLIPAVIAGAVSGIATCGFSLINTGKNVLAKVGVVFLDTLADGIIGGAEFVTKYIIDGYPFNEAIKVFGTGFVISAIISAGIKIIAGVVGLGIGYIKTKILEFKNNGLSKLSKESAEEALSESAEASIKNGIKESVEENVENVISKNTSKQLVDEINIESRYMPKDSNPNWKYVNNDTGDVVTKKQVTNALKQGEGNFSLQLKDTASPELKAKLNEFGVDGIPIKANMEPDFSKVSILKQQLELSFKRTTNFTNIKNFLKNQWNSNPDSIPKVIKDYFINNNVELGKIKINDINKMMQTLEVTFHEFIENGKTYFSIVYRAIHNVTVGGIGHSGAISELTIEYIVEKMAEAIGMIL